MKKILSLMLVLVMAASVIAIPAMAGVSATDEYTSLPYKTENFARFRNGITANPAAANLGLSGRNAIGVSHDELPLYGDSALIGVHNVASGESFYTTEDINNNATSVAALDVGIVADTTSTASGVNYPEKALKLSATTEGDVRGVSFGFVPNEVLTQVEGIYFKWDERVVTAGTAYVIPQWIDETGLVIANGNVIEVEHTSASDSFAPVMVTLTDNSIVYNDGDAQTIELDLAAAPDGAVGIKLLVEAYAGADGFERYFKNLEVGTISNNMAALEGSANVYSNTATSVVVNFAAPVVDGADNVKLYKNNVVVEGATYEWDDADTAVTITTPDELGLSAGYRVSTSKASTANGSIINDVTFYTTIKAATSDVVAPNKVDIYDLTGNKLNSSYVINENDIDINIYLSEGAEMPTSVVPVFYYEGTETGFNPDFFYNLVVDDDNPFATVIRGAYPIINGVSAIPCADFILFQGGHASKNASYNVSISAEEIPEAVTATISAEDGMDINDLNLLAPVKVTFSHAIEDTDALVITEVDAESNESTYDAYSAEWSFDKKEVVITPATMWTLGATYTITIPVDASAFGELVDVVADDLVFVATSTIPGEATIETVNLAAAEGEIIYSYDAEGKTIVVITKSEESIDLSAITYEVTVDDESPSATVSSNEVDATLTDGVFTGTIDLTDANNKENAEIIAVDNGFGVINDYYVYYISAINPPEERVDLASVEDFEEATVGQRFKDGNIIASSGLGSYGQVSHGDGNTNHNAKVVEEGDNRFLRLSSYDKGTSWVGFASVAVPKSFYANATKLVFAYDVRQKGDAQNGRAGVGGASTATSAAGGAGQKSDLQGIGLFASGGWNTWFTSGSFARTDSDSQYLKRVSPSNMYGDTSNPSWQSVEWILENAIIPEATDRNDDYEGTFGTRLYINSKAQGADEWNLGTPSEVAAWNFKNSNYLRFYITNDGSNAEKIGDYDNFRIYALTQDLATTVTLSGENVIPTDGYVEVTFKTPINPGDEDYITFTDVEGNTADFDFSWSDDRLTLSLYPQVEGNKVYKLASAGLTDIYGNEISVMADVPVLPSVPYTEYDEENAEYTILSDDYSQTANIFYRYTQEGTAKANIDFIYGSEKSTVREVKIEKPEEGITYALATVKVPDAVVTSGEEAIKMAISAEGYELDILGVYFEAGITLEDIAGVNTEEEALEAIETLAEVTGRTAELDTLVEDLVNGLVDSYLEKVTEDGDFATLEDAREWFETAFDEALENQPDLDKVIEEEEDTRDSNNKKGPSYNTTVLPTDIPQNPAQAVTHNFTDLGSVSWAKKAIDVLYAAGIINGVSDTEFAPLNNVTREEFVKLIVVAFDLYDPFLKSDFEDVEAGAWYDGYVASAVKSGIVKGVSDTEFGVGQNITREQMATMLYRACEMKGIKLDKTKDAYFNDTDSVSDYAQDSVEILSEAGVFSGVDGAFLPQDDANRAMAAQVVYLVYIIK